MVEESELLNLCRKASRNGATVIFAYGPGNSIETVRVIGLAGVGGAPMPPVQAAERLRAALQVTGVALSNCELPEGIKSLVG